MSGVANMIKPRCSVQKQVEPIRVDPDRRCRMATTNSTEERQLSKGLTAATRGDGRNVGALSVHPSSLASGTGACKSGTGRPLLPPSFDSLQPSAAKHALAFSPPGQSEWAL